MPKVKTLKIKLFDKSLPVPEYKSKGAAGFDLHLRKTVTIGPHQVVIAPANVAMEIPKGTFAMVAARGSTHKYGVMLANGIGVGDEDYHGDDDEYMLALLNFTNKKVTIKKGERVGQIVLLHYEKVKIKVVERLGNPNRGGFGSTGKK